MNRKWFVFLVAAIAIIGLVILPAFAQGLDLNAHCQRHGRARAVNIDGTAFGWKCEDSNGVRWDMSIQNACDEQHGSGTRATYTDMNNPNSWICVRDQQPTSVPVQPTSVPVQPTAVPPQPPQPTPLPTSVPPAQPTSVPQSQPTAVPPSPGLVTRGLDLSRWCGDRGLEARLVGNGWAGDWRCGDQEINIAEVCQVQQGLPYVGLEDGYNAFGWYCANQPVRLVQAQETRSGSNPVPTTPPNSTDPTPIPAQVNPDPGPAYANQETNTRNGECTIQSFTMTPSGPYVLGQEVTVRIQSNCSTVRFLVNGSEREQLGAPNHTYTFRTSRWGNGYYEVCGEGRTRSSWNNSSRRCFDTYVGPAWRVNEYQPTPRPSSNTNTGGQQCNSLSNLFIGAIAIVSDADTTPLNVRHQPSTSSGVKFTVPIRELVSIISGPVCEGNLVWWEIGRNGNSGWAAEINGYNNRNLLLNGEPLPGGGNSGSGNTGNTPISTTQPQATAIPQPQATGTAGQTSAMAVVDYYHPGWNYSYQFSVNIGSCDVVNGAEIISREIERFNGWYATLSEPRDYYVSFYFLEVFGQVEGFRKAVQRQIEAETGCIADRQYYLVGSNRMDMSGLGNVMYGYYFIRHPGYEEWIANITQGFNPGSPFRFSDNDDDRSQRALGEAIANHAGQNASVNPSAIAELAEEGLH